MRRRAPSPPGIHAHAAAARACTTRPTRARRRTCTIGGNVACNAAGPHTLRYGVTADFVAGITAVLSDGRIVRLGEGGDTSASGLLSLLVGSEGTLGVITEVLLRLIPAPKARSTLAATFSGMERAAAAVAEISEAGIVPAALEFLDAGALDAVRKAGRRQHRRRQRGTAHRRARGRPGHRRRGHRGRLHRDHPRRRFAAPARDGARSGAAPLGRPQGGERCRRQGADRQGERGRGRPARPRRRTGRAHPRSRARSTSSRW